MSYVLSLIQSKGGSGKSTLTCLLAQALVNMKKNIILIDTDPQKTSSIWAKKNKSNVDYLIFDIEKIKNIIPTIKKLKKDYDYLIIDTAGFENKTNIFVIGQSDLVLIPIQESNPDIQGALKVISLIKQIQDMQESHLIKYGVVFNNVNKRTTAYETAEQFIRDKDIPIFFTIPSLIAFKEMHSTGGVNDHRAFMIGNDLLQKIMIGIKNEKRS